VIKNTFANYAFEHYEIAAYRSLLTMAGAVGDANGPDLLQESLDEEIRMARWIEEHIDEITRTYMRLEATGQKSGV
jgi:ferritin-like metal-binding protein YciE